MKKIYLYFSMLAAIAAGCDKAETDSPQNSIESAPDVKMVTETIYGTTSSTSTRVTIADSNGDFSWTQGDHIAVHVSKDNSHKYVLTSDEGGSGASATAATASFTVAYDFGYARDAFAVFPSTIVNESATNYGQDGSTLDVTLPPSYTRAQVTGTTTPCPMIAGNTGEIWEFKQLCSLLRLTVSNIPATAKRLEIDFNGKKVWGDFSIAADVTPGTSFIATTSDEDYDIITITKDGSDAVLLEEEDQGTLILNIPLPLGTYSNITVHAYDALTGGASLMEGTMPFAYTAEIANGIKKSTALSNPPYKIKFTNNSTELTNLRFVRIFSSQNKLKNGATTYGPFTTSSDTNLPSPITADLTFADNDGDQIVFQVVDANGNVYSASTAPLSKNETVEVTRYTFSVATGRKVCFSPGDLGVDNGVYSFTEPFEVWNQDKTNMTNKTTVPSKRTWFIKSDVQNGQTVYGINWRIQDYAPEWNYLVGINDGSKRTIDSGNVSLYYKVHINTTELGDRYWCYLLPPDQTTAGDIEDDLKNYKEGTDYYEVTDYIKYIAKGFVLLMDTEYSYRYSTNGTWTYKSRSDKHSGYYQAGYVNSSKTYFDFGANGPVYNAPVNGADYRIHTRYIHDVE
jgi:hypothetical protein